ncbi:MAG: IclR family transcriptional regulator [Acidobacteria bacterium]|nr:MAG: IclR family transcriptional regulator [Acidobacteriota bacterium]
MGNGKTNLQHYRPATRTAAAQFLCQRRERLNRVASSSFLNCSDVGIYHLGLGCFSLGQAALAQLDIRRLSLPYLQKLNQQTRETVHLTVRHGLAAVYVEKLDSSEPLRIYSRIGAAVPLYCSAVGKVLLAYMPPQELANIIPQLELKRMSANTIGSIQELQTHLQKVRRNGYACDLEENEPHIRCIAAPVWDHSGMVNASLSITGPAVRMSMTRLRELAPLIQEAGAKISSELGYQASMQTQRGPTGVTSAVHQLRSVSKAASAPH